jgi:hypothetical protein
MLPALTVAQFFKNGQQAALEEYESVFAALEKRGKGHQPSPRMVVLALYSARTAKCQ